MLRYIAKRLLIAVPVLIGISLVSFLLIHMVPGDPVTAMLGTHYSETQAIQMREKYGLDKPLPVQYAFWLGNVLKGDLGYSMHTDQPVLEAIFERLPVTLQLAGGSVLLALLIAIPLGTLAAVKHRGFADHAASSIGLIGLSVPGFWLGTMLILFLSLQARWLPSGGFVPITEDLLANLRHMVLPTLALSGAVTAVILRMTRSSMLEVLKQSYVETARAKGVPRMRQIWLHAFRNALIPIVTIVGIQLGYLLGGSVVIERIFTLPGLGLMALQAIGNRDYPLLQGVILFVAVVFVMLNLMVDILYAWLDPRIRY